jgi:hypothetical protein
VDGREAGQVACGRADGREALAVLSVDLAEAPLLGEGGPLGALPLEDGLGRPV